MSRVAIIGVGQTTYESAKGEIFYMGITGGEYDISLVVSTGISS